MQGTQHYQPELFSTIDIESLVPNNHILRKLDKILDLSFVRELTKPLYCSNNGRPSIDPELFVRMLLIQYFYKIASDRQLCEEIGYNLAYRWFCRLSFQSKVPNHSSMTRIRDRFGEDVFQAMFERILLLCDQKGLIKSKSIMMDGSLFRADASLDSLEEINKDDDSDDSNPPSSIKKIKNKKISNKTHRSSSDPDCSLAMKAGQSKGLCYKAHFSSDSDSRVVLDCHISTGSSHETNHLQNRVNAIEEKLGITIEEVIADSGYGSSDNLLFLKSRGIESYIPLWRPQVGKQEDGFQYDEDKDIYLCPEGKHLTKLNNKDKSKIYRSLYSVCSKCPQCKECIANESQMKNHRGKFVRRHIHQDLFEEVIKKSKTSIFINKLRERMWKIEGLFGEAKNRHLLSRAKYRGRCKVQIQTYMVATVQNLKRIIAISVLSTDWVIEKLKFEKYREDLNILGLQYFRL